MFTDTSVGEDMEGTKDDAFNNNLDLDIGKLSISPIPYQSSCVAVDISSPRMVEPDVSATDILSAFDPVLVHESLEQRDGVVLDAKDDNYDSVGQAFLPRQFSGDEHVITNIDSGVLVDVAEQSAQWDCEAKDSVGTDETCIPSHSLIVYTSSRRSARSTKTSQKNGSSQPSNTSVVANECSEFDLSSLQVLRRSRSSFAKRARSSVWGDLGNILPEIDKSIRFDHNLGKERKRRSVKGGKCSKGKRKGIKDQAGKKSRGKTVVPTGRISLKIKIGNKFCIPGNTFENFSGSEKNVSELLDTKENMSMEEVSRDVVSGYKTNSDKVMSSNGSALSTHLQVRDTYYNQPDSSSKIRSLEEGDDSSIGLTEIRCSDVGTSPDSEVINSIPDVSLCEKGLPDLQDGTIVSRVFVSKTEVSNLILSSKPLKKGKKKVKVPQVDNCLLGSKLTGAGTRNNASTPAHMKDVSCLSSPRTKSKKGRKKDMLCDLGNSMETNRKGMSTPNKANGPADLGVGGICYQSDATMRTEKPYLNGADTKLPSGFVTTSIVSNSTVVPCTNDREFLKCSTAKGGRLRDFPNEKETASRMKGIEKNFKGKETPSKLRGTGSLSNGAAEPINRMQFSSDGVKDQYDPLRNAWVLCDECQKWRRIPATLADQIEETDCGWICRDNTDENFADCSIPQEKSNSEINDELEISEGSCEDDAYGAFLKHNEDRSNDAQQSSWTLIKSNLFLQRSQKTQTIDDVMVCHCKPPSDGRLGCGAECLNRILNIECVQGTCPCGEFCSNQQFQKRKYAKLKWFRCGKKGYGLQALEDIPQGQFLIEYVGEVLDVQAYRARQREYSMNGHRHFYFMTLNGSEVIDACAKGNLGRFINHSCDPNCRTEKWMVNGEVCIGLFSLRDIKKGEEVTFDYNFVRVFGAAAKRCVCGSANCRGYIGGDLTNSEVIAQEDSDDEFAEPVMTCEDGEMNEDWNDIMLNNSNDREDEIVNEPSQNKIIGSVAESILALQTTEPSPEKVEGVNSGHVAEIRVGDGIGVRDSIDNISVADGKLNNNRTSDESLRGSTPAGPKVECEGTLSQMHDSSKVSSAHGTVIGVEHNKTLSSKVKCKRNLKHASVDGRVELAKSKSLTKTNSPLFSIKKSKPKVNVLKAKVSPDVDKLSAEQHKSKKLPKLPVDHHFEAVEEKLNELLDPEGGISKRKDASKGYLKLLFLTAATGNNGDGEAIQSNRDLSMILDALLKTKSRTVLVDIINKNGLQMLHNIMKRYRKEFIKTPILRKLLKVLEYLATREILNLEHITGGSPCPGVESFKDSVLSLAEHVDKQVHQIARNFRDKWIPRSLRNYCCVERDECHQPSSHGGSSVSYDRWGGDGSGKPSETTNSIETGSIAASGTAETSALELSASGTSNQIIEPKTRKRKSRWDNPAEYPNSRIRNNLVGDEDIPPGFSHPSHACSTATNHQEKEMPAKLHSNIVSGTAQMRFDSRLPVSYGIPNSVMQHFRDPQAEMYEGWNIAPGVPFLPFPPLPPCPPGELDRSTSSRFVSSSAPIDTCPIYQTDRQNKRSCSMNSPEKNASVANSLPEFQQGGSCSLGRKYFRQQKWNPPKLPPWVRMRYGFGFAGNNTRSGSPGVGLANEPSDCWNTCNWEEKYRR